MAAAAVGRRGGKARARRDGGRCDLIIGDGGHGAGAGKLGLASGRLVTGAQKECDDDKARQQRGAALAHKGQGDAGQRDQAGYAANDQEGLEADGGRKARGTKGCEVGFSAGTVVRPRTAKSINRMSTAPPPKRPISSPIAEKIKSDSTTGMLLAMPLPIPTPTRPPSASEKSDWTIW